jgi:Glycosyl transferase 4-like domain
MPDATAESMKALFLSHTGMTEPLGRSQVLPYVVGLAERGVKVDLHSFEPSSPPAEFDQVRGIVGGTGGMVTWNPVVRSSSHHLVTKVREAASASMRGLIAALAKRPDVVHARSYLPAAVADVIATLAPGAKLLFDCRGMLGDEYVDAGHWTEDRVEYKLLKAVEKRLFRRSEGLVVLTHALKKWLRQRALVGSKTHISVIPCCSDLAKFAVAEGVREEMRHELGVGEHEALLVYSGSLGTWYQEEEMARCFAAVRAQRPAKFLLMSRSPTDSFRKRLEAAVGSKASDWLLVRVAPPSQMPRYLAAGDIGLSFIKSCFSKVGSSPTKVGEYLGAGLTTAMNGDIGDQQALSAHRDACIVLENFSAAEIELAAHRIVQTLHRPYAERKASAQAAAKAEFDLQSIGVERYYELYRQLAR